MIIEIDGKYYRLRYRDLGILRPEDKGLWRANRVDRSSITGEWYPCDDDDFLITDDWRVVARENGWDLRREEL
jgi:hypothetical protein